MGETTTIAWANATFNFWIGCQQVEDSPACLRCYAMRMYPQHWNGKRRHYYTDAHWREPVYWNQQAEKEKRRRRVFTTSIGDWAEGLPEQLPHLARGMDLIRQTPNLDWLMLTKRAENIQRLCPADVIAMKRVWMGVTAENQYWMDERWRYLRGIGSEIVWLSMEPIYERIRLPKEFLDRGRRGWVVVGGESGTNAVQLNLDWVRYVKDQCKEAGTPFFMKQMSQENWSDKKFKMFSSFPPDLQVREFPDVHGEVERQAA